jgi:DNA repair exonuclease SbcCD ATPase subunit
MLIGQESLSDILEHEARSLNVHLADHQLKQKQMEHDSKEGAGELTKLQRYYEETSKELKDLNAHHDNNLELTQNIKDKTNALKLENEELLRKEVELTQQTKERKEHMVEGIKLLTKYEADCQQAIQSIQEKELDIQKKIEEVMTRIQNGFTFLNTELESLT